MGLLIHHGGSYVRQWDSQQLSILVYGEINTATLHCNKPHPK